MSAGVRGCPTSSLVQVPVNVVSPTGVVVMFRTTGPAPPAAPSWKCPATNGESRPLGWRTIEYLNPRRLRANVHRGGDRLFRRTLVRSVQRHVGDRDPLSRDVNRLDDGAVHPGEADVKMRGCIETVTVI